MAGLLQAGGQLAGSGEGVGEIREAWTTPPPDELPDRDVSKIRHPLVTDTMDLLGPLLKDGKREGGLKVYFTHMNHTNPALDGGGAARRAIEARGFKVLEEGQELGL